MKTAVALSLLFSALSAFSINAGDFWTVVQNTSTYLNLDDCSKNCISKVNGSLVDVDTPCVAYGCVCTESTDGTNYVKGLENVKNCASACSDPTRASIGFADICAIYAAGITQPTVDFNSTILEITAPGYPDVDSCGRWCLNGCLDANGAKNEANCGADFSTPGWENYRGLATDQACSTAECLCSSGYFNSATSKLTVCTEATCGWPLSTTAAPFKLYTDTQDILINWCLRLGYANHNYSISLIGTDPTGNSSNLNTANPASKNVTSTPSTAIPSEKTWTAPNVSSLAVGIFCAFAALITVILQGVTLTREIIQSPRRNSHTGNTE